MTNFILNTTNWNESRVVESHICRICLSISDLLIPIFTGEGLEQELQRKIEKHLPVNISQSDVLPQKLCYQCANILMAWDSLYDLCIKTNEKLNSSLNAKSPIKKIISGKELLMPPKKRKPKGSRNKMLSTKAERTKKKFHTQKKIMKGNRSGAEEREKHNVNGMESESTTRDDFPLDNSSLPLTIKIESEVIISENGAISEEGNFENEELDMDRFKCNICSKTFNNDSSLNNHIKKFHDSAKDLEGLRCEICKSNYKTRANLNRHYLKEHLTNQVPCPVCQTSLNSRKLELHLKSIHGVKTENENMDKFKCKLCEKWFKNKYVRNSHMKEVHLSEPIKCKLCDFEGARTVLRRHKRDVHTEKRFLCSLCLGAFKTLHTLKMHMTSHSDIRCYTCDICGMGFKRLNNVRDHMKCHEQKSNQCQICGNFFARKRYLALHEKTIHNFYADGVVPEEKGFDCEICGAKLKWKKNLLAHMRIHTGEKPYVCKICNKDFICHASLRTHMAKHSVCVASDIDSQTHSSADVNPLSSFNPE